jgi:hypothetical protein
MQRSAQHGRPFTFVRGATEGVGGSSRASRDTEKVWPVGMTLLMPCDRLIDNNKYASHR